MMIDILKAAGRELDAGVQPYSGRAMYGSTCAGIWGELTEVLAAVVRASPDVETAAELVRQVRWDSPVVYWPNIKCDKPQVLRSDVEDAMNNGVDGIEDLAALFEVSIGEIEKVMSCGE
jgi:hypothetical protein